MIKLKYILILNCRFLLILFFEGEADQMIEEEEGDDDEGEHDHHGHSHGAYEE